MLSSAGLKGRLNVPAHFGRPPAQADQQKAPVFEKFWRLALEPVPNELQHPADHKQACRDRPNPTDKNPHQRQQDRSGDQRNSDGVTGQIGRVLVALGVISDPDIPGFAREHVVLLSPDQC